MAADAETTPDDWLQRLRRSAADGVAAEELFPIFYSELHRLAENHLRRSGGALTLGATTLLHEAYVNMVGRHELTFAERSRFFAYAARVMRGLTIDYLRRRHARKRGSRLELTLDECSAPSSGTLAAQRDLTALADSMQDLAAFEPRLAELIDLHFFGGLSFIEIAGLREVSERTVQRDWQKAKLLLRQALASAP
jgi:RNA polymerase sigma factor (TIGR02999 family)